MLRYFLGTGTLIWRVAYEWDDECGDRYKCVIWTYEDDIDAKSFREIGKAGFGDFMNGFVNSLEGMADIVWDKILQQWFEIRVSHIENVKIPR